MDYPRFNLKFKKKINISPSIDQSKKYLFSLVGIVAYRWRYCRWKKIIFKKIHSYH